MATLSGGERGRVALARQLVAPADVLLLDEPTNHLDLETTRWLEDHLLGLDATVLVITHDRAFLARLSNRILHFEARTITAYKTGYAGFVEQRAERQLSQQRAFDKQREEHRGRGGLHPAEHRRAATAPRPRAGGGGSSACRGSAPRPARRGA